MSDRKEEQTTPRQKGKQIAGKVKELHERLAKEPMPEILNRPELQNRSMAVLIDLVAAVLFFFCFAIIGNVLAGSTTAKLIQGSAALVGALFLLLKDCAGGRSPGKRLVGLKVIRSEGVGAIDPVTSAVRNWPLASIFLGPIIASFLGFLPFSGVIAGLTTIGGVGILVYETYRVLMDREAGERLGDTMAKTRVVEE